MGKYTVTLSTLDGHSLTLAPRSLTLTSSLSSPARSMRGSFPLNAWPPEFSRVRVYRDGSLLLEGRPDLQTARLGPEGMTLELSARTKGAALLDNEACPRVYENLTTYRLFDELIAPFDFVLVLPSQLPPLPEFTVRKGMTLWDAFSTYTRRVHNVAPHVDGDMVRVRPPSPGDPVTLGTPGSPILRMERTISHYAPLSRVYMRGELGDYGTLVENSSATMRQIRRDRYLIPAGEYVSAPAWDAKQRIQNSMRELLVVKVTVPGYLSIRPGQGVLIDHPQAVQPNLLAEEVAFTLDERGARTALTLKSALFY